ncbi:histidinol-phosphate transaminase [Treponema sp.]
MSAYWNDRVRKLQPYVPGEQPQGRSFIKLNTNENPYPPSPHVLEAIREAASDRLRLYPDPECLDLRKAIAERYATVPERVFVGNGSDELLAFAFGAFFGPRRTTEAGSGDRAWESQALDRPLLFPDVSYSFYPVYAELWDIPFQTLPLAEDFSIDPADYRRPSSGVIFPNPNAPTSRALRRSEILPIAEYQGRTNRVVLVDEAYVDFGAESVLRDTESYPNLLAVHTLSKSRSLAGLRVGFAIGNAELIEGLRRIKDSFNSYTLDRCAQAGAAAALADTAYYDGITARVVATRERSAAALESLGFRVLPSAANFLFVRHPRFRGEALFAGLRERGLLVRYFKKPRIEEFLRISVGTDEEMDALLAACAELVG